MINILCPICQNTLRVLPHSNYIRKFLVCNSTCFKYKEFKKAPTLETLCSKCFAYNIPILYKNNVCFLQGCEKTNLFKIKLEVHSQISWSWTYDKLIIRTDFMPLDLENTKQSVDNIFNRLIKLISFL
jgi:hypothetical protein